MTPTGRARLIVGAAELASELADGGVVVADATAVFRREADGGYSISSGREGYLAEHLPGTVFADVPGDFSDPDSALEYAIPSSRRFAGRAGALGLDPALPIVVYARESPVWATRLWWLLRYFGYPDVRVLDGGLGAWRRAGYPVESATTRRKSVTIAVRPRPELLAHTGDVAAVVTGMPGTLVNALSAREFRGEGPAAHGRPGRIPGSVSVPSHHLLDRDTGCLLDHAALAEALGRLVDPVAAPNLIAYCGSGVTATLVIFALAVAGREDARLYDGSLSQWSADPGFPMETG